MLLIDELIEKVKQTSSVVLGVDPNFELLPEEFRAKTKQDLKVKLNQFCSEVLQASVGLVAAVKFQSGYFEQFGLTGLEVLKDNLILAKKLGLLTIMDAKRGDIGSTNLAYSKAYFESGADLESDFLTINPFLGLQASSAFFSVAKEKNKGLFALVKTSNPDSNLIQEAVLNGRQVSETVAGFLNIQNLENLGDYGYGNFGAVVGATKADKIAVLRKLMPNTFWLVPGYGAQGGDYSLVKNFFNSDGLGAIFPMSRELTYPSFEEIKLSGFREAVKQRIQKAVKLIHN